MRRLTSAATEAFAIARRCARLSFRLVPRTKFIMPKMRAAQVARAGGPIEIVEREIPQPGPGWVRIKVQACGICHSDSLVKQGLWPGLQYPRVPGHEVVGIVDEIGRA